jgi:hypothetical protein
VPNNRIRLLPSAYGSEASERPHPCSEHLLLTKHPRAHHPSADTRCGSRGVASHLTPLVTDHPDLRTHGSRHHFQRVVCETAVAGIVRLLRAGHCCLDTPPEDDRTNTLKVSHANSPTDCGAHEFRQFFHRPGRITAADTAFP